MLESLDIERVKDELGDEKSKADNIVSELETKVDDLSSIKEDLENASHE